MSVASVRRYEAIPSTMDLLHELAAEGAEQGTTVVAEEQLGGRGSRGRSWHSPRGGLWLSYLLRPAAAGTELLSLRVGLAVVDALDALAPALPLGLKWPNDLMLGDRKLGGILCEARWASGTPTWVAVGVGINVGNAIPPGLGAVALREYRPGVTPDALLDLLLPRLNLLDRLSPRFDDRELDRLAARDWLAGRRLSRPLEGHAEGITADGALRVRRDDGTPAEVRVGTVELASPSDPA